MKRIYLITPLLLIFVASMFLFIPTTSTTPTTTPGSITYESVVCVEKNGVPVGDCTHNLVFNAGLDLVRDAVALGDNASVLTISLCNSSTPGAGCGIPVAAASEAYQQFAGCGLGIVQGTYGVNGASNGNWSVFTTFTSTCDNIETNSTRLQSVTGANFSGNTFTATTLSSTDQLTVNWTVFVQNG